MRKRLLMNIIAIIAFSIFLTGCEDMKQVVSGLEKTRDYLQEADVKLKEARGLITEEGEAQAAKPEADEAQAAKSEATEAQVAKQKDTKSELTKTETEKADSEPVESLAEVVESNKKEIKGDTLDTGLSKKSEKDEEGKTEEKTGEKEEEEKGEATTDSEPALAFADGMAQPIIEYSDGFAKDYSNRNSEILRFTVYVETDNDTDADGLADLVKVFVQVPRAAAEGKYKVASLYDPSPDNVGVVDSDIEKEIETEIIEEKEEFDFDVLYDEGEKRTPSGTVTTTEHADVIDSSEWIYSVPGSGEPGYKYGKKYDYYLTRGFAVIEASGLGTYGSEGYALPGFDLERDAHRCVVEWLTGKRTAYADRFGTETIEADWSNGNVAMTGQDYGASLSYETATTGVEGLKTVIPVSISNRCPLITYAGGCLFLDDDWTVVNDEYTPLVGKMAAKRNEDEENYTEKWSESDYSDDYKDIQCSALIVQGMNDSDMSVKQADLMYETFEKGKNTAKLVLHQDGHNSLEGRMINDELWDEIMNKWLSHYLYDIDNGIEEMAPLNLQSNVDGSYAYCDSWHDFDYKTYEVSYEKKKSAIASKGLKKSAENYFIDSLKDEDKDLFYLSLPSEQAAVYSIEIPEETTVCGATKISFSASTGKTESQGLMATAVLIDTLDGETDFKAFVPRSKLGNVLPVKTVGKYNKTSNEKGRIKEFVKADTKAKIIGIARIDITKSEGNEYTFYMQPTVYTIEKGHKLKLVLTTYDPELGIEGRKGFTYTVDNTTLKAEIPVKKY